MRKAASELQLDVHVRQGKKKGGEKSKKSSGGTTTPAPK